MFRRSKSVELTKAEDPSQRPAFVAKVLYAPVKLVSKRVAPRLSSKLFAGVWSTIDSEQPPPRPDEPQGSVAKLALALALEGAVAAVVSGLLDHESRRKFARLTGRWPGRAAKS